MEKIGSILKKYRLTHNLTQSQIANIIGISTSSYQRFERNERFPRISVCKKIEAATNIKVEVLLGINRWSSIDSKENFKNYYTHNATSGKNESLLRNSSIEVSNIDQRVEFDLKLKELLACQYINKTYNLEENSITDLEITKISKVLFDILDLIAEQK